MAFKELPIERLSQDELHQLELIDLNNALRDVAAEIMALGKLAILSRHHLADCKKDVLRDPSVENKCKLEDAKAHSDAVKLRSSTVKLLQSNLQTLMRNPI